jgi:hypothetical protein
MTAALVVCAPLPILHLCLLASLTVSKKPAPCLHFADDELFQGASFLGNHAMIVGFNRPNNRSDIES